MTDDQFASPCSKHPPVAQMLDQTQPLQERVSRAYIVHERDVGTATDDSKQAHKVRIVTVVVRGVLIGGVVCLLAHDEISVHTDPKCAGASLENYPSPEVRPFSPS